MSTPLEQARMVVAEQKKHMKTSQVERFITSCTDTELIELHAVSKDKPTWILDLIKDEIASRIADHEVSAAENIDMG